MRVSARDRAFDDPGVLRLRQSEWHAWELRSPQYFQGDLSTQRRTGGTKRPQADQAELAALMEELGL